MKYCAMNLLKAVQVGAYPSGSVRTEFSLSRQVLSRRCAEVPSCELKLERTSDRKVSYMGA